MGESMNQFNYSDNDLYQSGGFNCDAVNSMFNGVKSVFGSESTGLAGAIKSYDLKGFELAFPMSLNNKKPNEKKEFLNQLDILIIKALKSASTSGDINKAKEMLRILKNENSSFGGFSVLSETLTEDLVTENGKQYGTLTENSTEQFLDKLVQNLKNESDGGYSSEDDGYDTEELIQITKDKLFSKDSHSKHSTNDLISMISSKVKGYLETNGPSQAGGNCDGCGCDNNYSIISELYSDDGDNTLHGGGSNAHHYTDFSETQVGLSESSYYGNPLGGYDTPSNSRQSGEYNANNLSATSYDVDYMKTVGQNGGFNVDNFSVTSYDEQCGGYNANDFSATSYDIDYTQNFGQKGGHRALVDSDFSYNQYNNNTLSATSYDVDYDNRVNMVGGNLSENLENLNTEQLISKIKAELESSGGISGGAKKSTKIYGERSIPTSSSGIDVTNAVNEQTDKIYEKIVKKIDDLLTGEMKKKKSELKDLVTKVGGYTKYIPYVYKTAIRSEIKKNNPELKSELDVAIEIDKVVSLEKLLGVKIEFWVKELSGYIEKLKKRDSGEHKPSSSNDKKKSSTKSKGNDKKKESEESYQLVLSSDISSSSV